MNLEGIIQVLTCMMSSELQVCIPSGKQKVDTSIEVTRNGAQGKSMLPVVNVWHVCRVLRPVTQEAEEEGPPEPRNSNYVRCLLSSKALTGSQSLT